MAMTEGIVELLEAVRIAAELNFISDLHSGEGKDRISAAVRAVPAGSYTVEAWRDAAHYITGTNRDFVSVMEAKDWILRELRKA